MTRPGQGIQLWFISGRPCWTPASAFKKGNTMNIRTSAIGLSSLFALLGGCATVEPAPSPVAVADQSYIACNQYNQCWRVHRRYAYGEVAPITYYNADWYETHRTDERIRWLPDPQDDRGYYDREGTWRSDPAARALTVGATGAGVGAAIGCLVTLPIGCAPGAAVGAAVGGGAGAVAGAASTPPHP